MARSFKALLAAPLLLLGASAWAQEEGAEQPVAPVDPAEAAQPPGEEGETAETAEGPANQICLDCHGDEELAPTMSYKSEGKTQKVLLFTDGEKLGASVHAKLLCVDCHTQLKDATEDGHESFKAASLREATIRYSEGCKECHFDNYTKTLDSVHHQLIAKGDFKAAVCSDCHGSHEVMAAAEPRSTVAKTCEKCHADVVKVYAQSVHGQPLVEGDNPDVPACTDCHRSHDIADPKAAPWKLSTPQMCGSCHTNETMMKKYGLSTNVLSTYLADFHGATSVLQQGEEDAKPVVALCTDCHGVHDIKKADDPNSAVVQQNLVKTCAKCHPDASANFPAAWLSHYEPTWEKAPVVFAVKVFYQWLIPFMIGGLILQIALHFWRVVVNR